MLLKCIDKKDNIVNVSPTWALLNASNFPGSATLDRNFYLDSVFVKKNELSFGLC